VAFIYTKAESFQTKRGDVYKHVARAGFAPLLIFLIVMWLALNAMTGSTAHYDITVLMFRSGMVVTGIYAFVAVFMYL
jgi:hypothetical protein